MAKLLTDIKWPLKVLAPLRALTSTGGKLSSATGFTRAPAYTCITCIDHLLSQQWCNAGIDEDCSCMALQNNNSANQQDLLLYMQTLQHSSDSRTAQCAVSAM